jgi:hypothetical protein
MTRAAAEVQTPPDTLHEDIMTDTQRRTHSADPDRVEVREATDEDDSDGQFRIRMPVSSTLEARDGEAFSRSRLEGWVRQIESGDVGVFLDHGRNASTGSRYSALGKLGYWADPSVEDRDGGAELVADAVLMDPAELNADVGGLRAALATLRAQAEAGVPLASSVGWSEDTGDRDLPGDSDLLEISIVGIPSDPNTTTASTDHAALARAVSTAADGFDPDAFAEAYRAITQPDVEEATPVAVDGAASTTARNEVEVDGTTIDLTPPERVTNAVTLGRNAKAEYDDIADCGTGTGEAMAEAILGDDLTPEILLNGGDVADSSPSTYLESHESDLDADGPPTEWDADDWTGGCAEVQQALWGFYTEWFADKEAEIEDAMDDDRNLDDPEFSPGDAVMWTWQGEPFHGRVNDIHEQYTPPAADDPITGEDGEAVYSIYEYDEETEELADSPNVAKTESSLSESTADIPTRMSEDRESGAESDADRDEPSLRGMEEKMDEMREMLDENTRMCEEMYEEMVGSDGENADGEDEDEDGEDDEGDMEENSASRTVEIDGEERAVDDIADELRELRADAADAEPDGSKTTARAETSGEDDETAESDGDVGFTGNY